MKTGLIYPAMELGGDIEALRRIGLLAEELGYDHLLAGDHVLGAHRENRDPPLVGGPYDEHTPFHDPFVIFSYLAGMTQRINFVSSVLILPQRQTVLVAKQAAELDLVSGGRFTMGVGTGWSYVEYDAMGKAFANRGKRMNEQIALLRELWTKELVDFRGEFESVDRAALIPRPKRPVPIYMGGFADVTFRRAARIGDGFIFADVGRDVFECLSTLRGFLREEGRSAEGFGQLLAMGTVSVEDTVETALRWRDAGGTHASVWTMDRGFTTADAHMDFAKRAADALRKAGLLPE